MTDPAFADADLERRLATLLAAADRAGDDVTTHLHIYEVAQLLRRPALALEHQRRAIALATIHSTVARDHEDYALLVPCVAGLWTANTPVELLVDPDRVTVHRWYVEAGAAVPPLPRHDAVLVGAGESQPAGPVLDALAPLLDAWPVPVINRPTAILQLGRIPLGERFAGARLCRVPRTVRTGRGAYARDGFPTPHIVRPVDSHGGQNLARIDDADGRAAYLAAVAAAEFYVSGFVDYRSADGYFRKYRIIFVDGEPFPFHLAISPRWMVHYYNAPMQDEAWMRAEEHAFLARPGDVFAGPLAAALSEAADLLDLDYVGIDCAIDRDGKLLIFEADNALIVHLLDDPALFGYKHEHVPRIFAALDAMVRRRIAAA